MKDKLLFYLKNVFLFGIAKGVSFVSPILLANFITINNYGKIEYAYSLGSVIAIGIGFGFGGAYPYFILKKKDVQKEPYFYAFAYYIFFLSIVFVLGYQINIIDRSSLFIYLFSAIFTLQRIYSSILKSKDKGYIAVFFDGGYYFILTIVIILLIIKPNTDFSTSLLYGMKIYLVSLIALFIYNYKKIKKNSSNSCAYHIKQITSILRYSLPLVLSGIIIYWLTSSARIYIKFFLDYIQVGIYSLHFRFAGISFAIYMFLYIVFFKKLYLSNPKKLDKYFVALMFFVLLGNVILYYFIPIINEVLFHNNTIVSPKIFFLLAYMLSMWVGIALNQGIIGRENLVSKMNIALGVVIIIFPIFLFFLKQNLTLELFTYLNIISFMISYLAQIKILGTKNIKLLKSTIYILFIMVLSTFTYFIF